MATVNGESGFTQFVKVNILDELRIKGVLVTPGGGSFDRVDAGALTNAQILALSSPAQLTMAFSTTDFINYTFFNTSWYSTAGGILT